MARSLWRGSINFGLVTILVQLFSAVRDRDVHFHMLDQEGCRLRRKLVCPDDDREVPYDKTVLGYEVAPDEYVVVEKRELEALRPESGRTIHITDFVRLPEIDPQYYDRPYLLIPDEGGKHAYSLLLAAMQESNRAGIASFVMRQKQYLSLIRPLGERLGLVTMRYADEIVEESEFPAIETAKSLPKRELQTAVQLVEAMADKFDPQKYRDDYRDQVKELIEQKAQGKTPKPVSAKPARTRVINLMDALKASLAERQGDRKADPPAKRRTSERRSTGRRRKVS